MKKKNFIKIFSLLMLAIVLVSTFSMPVLATADGEVEETPTFWDGLFDAVIALLSVIVLVIFAAVSIVFLIIVILLALIFELGEALFNFISLIVTGIGGLF